MLTHLPIDIILYVAFELFMGIKVPFDVMHGCHNNFILVDEFNGEIFEEKSRFVVSICALTEWEIIDSVLFLSRTNDADCMMRIFDRDGSEETMCGNGIRCVAKYYFDHYSSSVDVCIKTLDGLKYVKRVGDHVRVNMGQPRDFKKIGDYYYVFTGCPHVVVIKPNFSFDDVESLTEEGRKLSHDFEICSFLGVDPEEGVYINFINPKTKTLVTYERHVERCTYACGTGNTATGYVLNSVLKYAVPVDIINFGGVITVDVDASNDLFMTGPAEYVTKGSFNFLE